MGIFLICPFPTTRKYHILSLLIIFSLGTLQSAEVEQRQDDNGQANIEELIWMEMELMNEVTEREKTKHSSIEPLFSRDAIQSSFVQLAKY